MNETAIVVFSGGQDSTTCLFWAKKHFKQVHTVCFDYGQRHAAEVEVARAIAEKANVSFYCIDLSFMPNLAQNALTDHQVSVDKEMPSNGDLPNTFVPGRNLFFLSIAAAYAYKIGARHIVTGVSQTDFSGYPDCRENFIKSMNLTLNLAMDTAFELHTPLMWKDKKETWQMADELGVLELVRQHTLTCYNGIVGDGCTECLSCKLRQRGLEAYLAGK